MNTRLRKKSVVYKVIVAVLLVMMLYGILSAAVFLVASKYQIKNVAGADIIDTSTNSERITRGYVEGNFSIEEFTKAISAIDKSWVGSITVWDSDSNLIYGEDSMKVFIDSNEQPIIQKSANSKRALTYSQANIIYITNENEIQAIIQVTDHTVTSRYIEAVFNKSLFFSLIIIFSLISIIILVASYKIERYILGFRKVMSQVAQGDYDTSADETMPAEFGEMAYTLNKLSSNIKINMNQLAFEKNKLNHILDSLSEGIIAFNKSGEITHINTAVYYLTGQYTKEIKQTNIVYESLKKLIDATAVAKIIQNGDVASYNISVQKDKVLNVSITPLYDNDTISGATALIRDVTEMERLENTRREYVSNVSHELRTPLTAMRGLIEPLVDGMVKKEADKRRYYDILLRETLRLSNLINELLQLSRLQSGSDKSTDAYFNIDELISYIYDKYSSIAKGKKLKLIKNIYENSTICANENRIEQIITILLDNAIKYSSNKGTVGIDVKKGNKHISFCVWDTGEGIANEDIDYIFDRFFKVDRSHNLEGTGLGLAIAKEIVELMGGTIFAESTPNKGSKFTFTIKNFKY